MKILVVALMLFVVKGIEAHALPGVSSVALIGGEGKATLVEFAPVPVKPITEIQNLSAIFENLPQISILTREFQQNMETLGANLEKQASVVRDKLSSLFEQSQGTHENTAKQAGQSIIQQLETWKKNISQLDLNPMPVKSNWTFEDTVQQDFTQKMEELQQIFVPLLDLFRGTITEGVENLRKSMSPGVQEIKKLVSESEAMTRKLP